MEKARHTESQSDSNSALASLRCSATRFPFSVKETVRLTGRNGSEVNVTSISSAIRSITLVLDCGFGMIVSKSVIYGDESDSKRRIKIPTAPRSSNTLSGMIIAVLDIEMQYISINLYLHHIIAICNYKILYTLDYIMQLQNIIKAASESENAARQNQGKNAFLLTQKTPCISSESSGRKPLNRWQKHPAWSLLVCLPSISTPVRTAFNNDSAKAL